MDKVTLWHRVLLVVVGLSSLQISNAASYTLDTDNSSLYFVSTKNTNVVESHYFDVLAGQISEAGVAELSIDLSSVKTGVDIRNQRMRDSLFEVSSYSHATVTVTIAPSTLAGLANGQAKTQQIAAVLNLHGLSSTIDTQVRMLKLNDSTIVVQNLSPILVSAGDYDLTGGIDILRNIANLSVISYTVPVNFTLFYSTDLTQTEVSE